MEKADVDRRADRTLGAYGVYARTTVLQAVMAKPGSQYRGGEGREEAEGKRTRDDEAAGACREGGGDEGGRV